MVIREHYYIDSEGNRIPAVLIAILKDDAIEVLESNMSANFLNSTVAKN